MARKYTRKNIDLDTQIKMGVKPPTMSEIQLENIKVAQEQFGVKVLSIEDLGQLELTPQNVTLLHKNIERENEILSGRYIDKRNKQYLQNYMDIISKAGVSEDVVNRLNRVIGNFYKKDLQKNYLVSSLLPPLKDWYITLKRGRDKNGRYVSINDQIDTIEEQLTTALDDLESLGYA